MMHPILCQVSQNVLKRYSVKNYGTSNLFLQLFMMAN